LRAGLRYTAGMDVPGSITTALAAQLPANLGLRPGVALRSVVLGTRDAPFLMLAGTKMPLPPSAGLVPGQAVTVELQQGRAGPELRVSIGDGGAAASPPPAPALEAAVGAVLARLSALAGRPLPPGILPRVIPPQEAIAQRLLALFMGPSGLADDLLLLRKLIESAGRRHVLPPGVIAWADSPTPDDPAALAAFVRQWASMLPVEARIARGSAGAPGQPPPELFDWLDLLLRDEGLRQGLRAGGALERFAEVAGRIRERLDAAQLQQLHAHDVPYRFVELPLPASAGFHYAQVHFFSDAGGANAGGAGTLSSIVLDLELSVLGPLWILLQHGPGLCVCTVKSPEPGTRALLEAARADLEGVLGAGGVAASVRVAPMEGDRLAAIAALVAWSRPLDVSA